MPEVLTTNRFELAKPRRFVAIVTVAVARQIIDQYNKENRKIRNNWVRDLARRMKDGLWKKDHGNSIVFSNSGELLDGQHRLLAVILSGIAVQMAVVTGADPDVRMFTDDGKARRAWDRITFVADNHVANEWASKMTVLLAFAKGATRRQCAADYLLDLFHGHEAGITWVAERPINIKGFSVAVHLAVALYYNAFPELAEAIWTELRNPLTNVTQAKLIRELAISTKTFSSSDRMKVLRRTLAGLRAHMKGQELTRLLEVSGPVADIFDQRKGDLIHARADS